MACPASLEWARAFFPLFDLLLCWWGPAQPKQLWTAVVARYLQGWSGWVHAYNDGHTMGLGLACINLVFQDFFLQFHLYFFIPLFVMITIIFFFLADRSGCKCWIQPTRRFLSVHTPASQISSRMKRWVCCCSVPADAIELTRKVRPLIHTYGAIWQLVCAHHTLQKPRSQALHAPLPPTLAGP